MIPEATLVLGAAVAVDLCLGELPNALHPVAWFGGLAARLFDRVPRLGRAVPLIGGTALTFGLVGGAAYGTHRLELALVHAPSTIRLAVSVFVLQATFAHRGLLTAGRTVLARLRDGATETARADLAALCSRDATHLDPTQLVTGATESLAENASDSVVGPMLAFATFGLPGAVAYRCINTLDAMYGYRDHREWLGKAPARLDDLANLVPARSTALLLWVAGAALGYDARAGLATYLRDRGRPPSPNGGHPMAMMAGLLRRRLDKPGAYVLGADFPPADAGTLASALRIVDVAGMLAMGLALLVTGFRGVG